jgi:hypothetical protein
MGKQHQSITLWMGEGEPLLSGYSVSSSSPGRWSDSSRWENTQGTTTGEQFLLKEKYGTYFKGTMTNCNFRPDLYV